MEKKRRRYKPFLHSTKGEDVIMSLRIASYNIHGWVDADMESNLERVAEVVNLQDPDILCLQVKCLILCNCAVYNSL